MPSAEHESPVALAKLDPDVVAWLLTNVFDVKVPDYHHARAQPTDVRVLVPRTYHADSMLLYCDPADRALLAVVLEVQRRWDTSKRRTWKLYVAQLEAELDVAAGLVVYCPDPKVARRYRDLFEYDGLSLSLRPMIFTPSDVPLVVDLDLARSHPALAVLATVRRPRWKPPSRHWRRHCVHSARDGRSCTMTLCWLGCRLRPGHVGRRS